jgi:hypothetical protein
MNAELEIMRKEAVVTQKSTIFWGVTPCSGKLGTCLSRWFLAQLIFSTLKMEATFSSITSVDTQRTTRRYIPEDGTLHNHRCENIKSYTVEIYFKVLLRYSPENSQKNHRKPQSAQLVSRPAHSEYR